MDWNLDARTKNPVQELNNLKSDMADAAPNAPRTVVASEAK